MFFSLIILSACNSNSHIESIVEPILSEFQETGIILNEKKEKSKAFTFAGSDEKHYEFNGGTVYLLFDFGSKKDRIVGKLTTLFAEAEFPYGVNSLYTDNFILVFTANSYNVEIEEKVDYIFQTIEKG
ncbi:hypothetical protein [Pontibacillus salipaludis]|uniref:hypothetical protein n=1 Tax=Pontibacillus salipaludis TaxID=1697394 RepID=UPI0031F05BDC